MAGFVDAKSDEDGMRMSGPWWDVGGNCTLRLRCH